MGISKYTSHEDYMRLLIYVDDKIISVSLILDDDNSRIQTISESRDLILEKASKKYRYEELSLLKCLHHNGVFYYRIIIETNIYKRIMMKLLRI